MQLAIWIPSRGPRHFLLQLNPSAAAGVSRDRRLNARSFRAGHGWSLGKLQQVPAAFGRALNPLLGSPIGDLLVIAAEQDVWDGVSSEFSGPRVLGELE